MNGPLTEDQVEPWSLGENLGGPVVFLPPKVGIAEHFSERSHSSQKGGRHLQWTELRFPSLWCHCTFRAVIQERHKNRNNLCIPHIGVWTEMHVGSLPLHPLVFLSPPFFCRKNRGRFVPVYDPPQISVPS